MRNLLLILLSSMVTFMAVEMAVRLISPQSDRFYQPDAKLGSKLKPNFIGMWYGEYVFNREFASKVTTNSWGFHDIEHAFLKNSRKMVIIGDSFIEALQVPVGQTVAQVLQAKLNQKEVWEVISLARAGVSTPEQIVLWEEYGAKIKPDYAVIVISKIDLLENQYKNGTVTYSSPRSILAEFMADKSHFVRLLARFKLKQQKKRDIVAKVNQRELEQVDPTITNQLIGQLISQIQGAPSKIIVVFIHDNVTAREKLAGVTNMLRGQTIPYFFFGDSTKPGNENLFFEYDGHLTAAGHQALATKIYELVN